MVIVSLALRVPLADQSEFLERTKLLVEQSRNEQGVLGYNFAVDIFDRELFRIFELYRDQDALDFHMATAHFGEWRANSGQYERTERHILHASPILR